MELDITFLIEKDPNILINYSASIAEIAENAGSITWENSLKLNHAFVSQSGDIDNAKRYFEGFGAWCAEEIAAWTNQELNAVILQLVVGDLREYLKAVKTKTPKELKRWEENHGGNIYKSGNKYYYYLGE